MRLSKSGDSILETEINMTPMIDVIFQLVLFFVFSLKFIALEKQINAFLPKTRGQTAAQDFDKELRQVTLFLQFDSAGGGLTTCRIAQYFPPDGGPPIDDYLFATDPSVRHETVAGSPRQATKTRMETMKGGKKIGGIVEYDYGAPDFGVIENYLSERKKQYDQMEGMGAGLRLTVNFEADVPWQMIVNIVDICNRVGITDFGLNPVEIEY